MYMYTDPEMADFMKEVHSKKKYDREQYWELSQRKDLLLKPEDFGCPDWDHNEDGLGDIDWRQKFTPTEFRTPCYEVLPKGTDHRVPLEQQRYHEELSDDAAIDGGLLLTMYSERRSGFNTYWRTYLEWN